MGVTVIDGRTSSSQVSDQLSGGTLAEIARLQSELRISTTELIERAQASGDLRRDVRASDLAVVSFAVQSAGDFGSVGSPDLWRRVLGLVLDGMRTSRTAPSPLPVDALTDAELRQAFSRRRM